MLNELLTEKFIVNIIQRHVAATRFFIVQNCLAKKKKFYGNTVKSIDIVTPQKPKSNSTDEKKATQNKNKTNIEIDH